MWKEAAQETGKANAYQGVWVIFLVCDSIYNVRKKIQWEGETGQGKEGREMRERGERENS